MSHTDFDSIIIGSGAGGLAAAVALANAGQKVLVCEQHYVAGGWCHSFTLQGYRFSPGVHYIGGLQPGGMTSELYRGLGVSGDLAFCELNPDGYDHVLVGDERFDIPKGRQAYIERLKTRFPGDATGIDRLFESISRLMDQIKLASRVKSPLDAALLPLRAPDLLRWLRGSAQGFVDAHVGDPVLKAILLSQTGDHGVPPSRVSPLVHTSVMDHYFEGGYYPLGGGFAIPRAFVRALKRQGGELRLSTPVEKILIEAGRAVGVRLAPQQGSGGEEIRAKEVISNADPEVTLGRLVGREHLRGGLRRKLDKAAYSTSALSLFFAVDMDLRGAGLDSGNTWYYRDTNVDRAYRHGMTGYNLGPDPLDGLFLTATTLKDPSKMHSGHHTCEAFAFVGYDAFQKWQDGHAGEGGPRDGVYADFKETLTDKLFDAVEKIVPGMRSHVVFAELGTPLTNRYYLNATRGNLYGTAKTIGQIGPFGFQVKTGIDGLLMVGASTLSHGVAGAALSGLEAARTILNCRTRDLLDQHGPEIPIYSSEDVSAWPEHLQARIQRGQGKIEEDDPLAEISV
jgi:phytoene dehydrogenase-like protein